MVLGIQGTDAQIRASLLAGLLNAEAAISEHPVSGPRPQTDDILADHVTPELAIVTDNPVKLQGNLKHLPPEGRCEFS